MCELKQVIQRKTSSQKQLSMELSASRCFFYFLCDLVITELCQWPEQFLKPLISNRFPLLLWRIQCNKFHIHAVESKMILFMYDICFCLTFSQDEKFRPFLVVQQNQCIAKTLTIS